MFDRFTGGSRSALVLAQSEARERNQSFLGTEHLLVGVLRQGQARRRPPFWRRRDPGPAGWDVGAQALEDLGISLEAVRAKIAERTGPIDPLPVLEVPPFTPRAKHVLELAAREAADLGHRHIGTEHLLLGLLLEAEGEAAQVLGLLTGDGARLRARVLELSAGG